MNKEAQVAKREPAGALATNLFEKGDLDESN